MILERVFDELAQSRRADVADLDQPDRDELIGMGIRVDDNLALLADDVELLDRTLIRSELSADTGAWVGDLRTYPHIGSTNTALLAHGEQRRIDGSLWLAEVQTAGRGRRGRTWLSPFARNLAMTFGIEVRRPVAEIGSASLVVGLAVAEALADVGFVQAELKWPNDVLFEGRKLCGILIELPPVRGAPELVVGIGVNVGGSAVVKDRVDQGVADVTECVPAVSRNRLASCVANRVVGRLAEYASGGFASVKAEWQARHRFHESVVELVAGDRRIAGTVVGVGDDGALRLDTGTGVREFTSGEVSLRA